MKTYLTTLAAIVAAIIIADPAHATGNHTPKEPPSKPPVVSTPQTPATPPVNANANASTSSTSQAGAAAISGSHSGSAASTGPVSATGGTAAGGTGQGGSATAAGGLGGSSTAAAGDSNASAGGATLNSTGGDTRALALSFAPPATLPPMSAVQCASPQIRQETPFGAGVLGSFGRGTSSTDTSDCVLIGAYNSMVERCLFSSAKQVQDMLVKKHLPNFQAEAVTYLKNNLDPGFVDYSPTQCAEMRKPPAPPAPAVPVVIVTPPPAPLAPPPEPKKVSLSADALFDFDKDVLKPAGKQRLDELAATLRGEAANIIITGHTDASGSDQYNDRLSMRRANAVRAHLALAGVDLGRMVALGKGKREPVADNGTAEGRQLNRRVDVQITVPQASKRLERLVAGA